MKSFEQLGVATPLLQAIHEMGFHDPLPVQQEVIPCLLSENNDLIALAQTGTGKTAAFGIPILQKINLNSLQPQALILCPTRELCLQIAHDLNRYAKYIEPVKVLPVYGGANIQSQMNALKRGVHIIVATPGRLLDLMQRNALNLDTIKNVILDEADEMLDMGFADSIDIILAQTPNNRNMLLFSATMPPDIERLTRKYMPHPKQILIGKKNAANDNIRHLFYIVRPQDKYPTLKRLADFYPNIYAIIFCRTRKETQEIADALIRDGYNADALHGDLSQAQRNAVMQKFRLRNLQLLVATDVAARGLDVHNLSHIINYSLPNDPDHYTHRSGRTARAGKTGIAISICHSKEKSKILAIQRALNKQFETPQLPNGNDICLQQILNLADKIQNVHVNDHLATLLPHFQRKLQNLNKDDLIQRILTLHFNPLLQYYHNADYIHANLPNRTNLPNRKNIRQRNAKDNFSRFTINFGKNHGLYPLQLIELINRCVPGKIRIGKIDLRDSFAFFEIETQQSQRAMNNLNAFQIDGRRILVKPAK